MLVVTATPTVHKEDLFIFYFPFDFCLNRYLNILLPQEPYLHIINEKKKNGN